LFAGANLIYEQSHSRSLIFNKGLLTFNPLFTMLWFVLLIINFAGPFTLNLFSEINLIIRVTGASMAFLFPIFFLVFFSAAYCLNLFASSQQGITPSLSSLTYSLNPREIRLLLRHSWPIFFLLLDLNL
jgi:NADH:ubiquinone oxidoreductase subunit 4 (subunit M)